MKTLKAITLISLFTLITHVANAQIDQPPTGLYTFDKECVMVCPRREEGYRAFAGTRFVTIWSCGEQEMLISKNKSLYEDAEENMTLILTTNSSGKIEIVGYKK